MNAAKTPLITVMGIENRIAINKVMPNAIRSAGAPDAKKGAINASMTQPGEDFSTAIALGVSTRLRNIR